MRKKISLVLLFFLCIGLFSGCTAQMDNNIGNRYNYDDVKDALIRFHVIANSDSYEDQNLKLKVRDGIIEYLYPYLNESKSIEESRKIILQNKSKVEEIAQTIIRDNGYDYIVTSQLSRENFPEKAYGSITLPQGNYEAFRVIIGKGEGKNWWCVMFPPLCFIDVTKGKVEEEKSKQALDNQINSTYKDQDNQIEQEPEFEFKIVEIFDDIFN